MRNPTLHLIASALVEGFASPLQAAVLDGRKVDVGLVKSVLREAGAPSIVKVVDMGSLIVVTIDERPLEKQCMYERCGRPDNRAPPTMFIECMSKCLMEKKREISNTLISSMLESFTVKMDRGLASL